MLLHLAGRTGQWQRSLAGDLPEAISDFLIWNVKNLIPELLPIFNQYV